MGWCHLGGWWGGGFSEPFGSQPPSGLFAVGAFLMHRRGCSALSGHLEKNKIFLNHVFFKIADSCWSTTPVHKKRASPVLVGRGSGASGCLLGRRWVALWASFGRLFCSLWGAGLAFGVSWGAVERVCEFIQ